MVSKKKLPLGESLVGVGLISKDQLEKALKEQGKTGERIGRVLVSLGFVNEDDISKILGQQLGIPCVSLADYPIDPEVMTLVSLNVAKRYRVIPLLLKEGKILVVAMADPLNVFALDDLKRITRYKIEPVVSSEKEIINAIEQYYSLSDSLEEIMEDIGEQVLEVLPKEKEVEVAELRERAEEAPVVKLVNSIILEAVRDEASDIHIEPDEKLLRIRYRVDGILHEMMTPPRQFHPAVLSRIKIMAEMDIAEKRIPQDGRFQIKTGGKEIDIRASVLPTVFGEKAVLRLLDRSSTLLGLDQLGLLPEAQKRFAGIIRRPHGIILVTGPTGSGKTTTLYTVLGEINSLEKNIITLEDPVEYHLDIINQSQINPKVGMGFAAGLRSILRQDPDIIMVGEIRDYETAEIAIQAALTGHLVLSTLHTNDAPGSLTRLLDMGVEPFLLSSSIIGVVAQRLVRTICGECKKDYKPSAEILDKLGLRKADTLTFYEGEGCKKCKETGYKGRLGIFELMLMNEEIRELVGARASTEKIRQVAKKAGMQTLREDGIKKIKKGVTTIEEVLRVTQEEEQ